HQKTPLHPSSSAQRHRLPLYRGHWHRESQGALGTHYYLTTPDSFLGRPKCLQPFQPVGHVTKLRSKPINFQLLIITKQRANFRLPCFRGIPPQNLHQALPCLHFKGAITKHFQYSAHHTALGPSGRLSRQNSNLMVTGKRKRPWVRRGRGSDQTTHRFTRFAPVDTTIIMRPPAVPGCLIRI